jgi:hypothetical protein
VPELLRLLRDIVIPPPGDTGLTGCTGRTDDAATSTAPARPTSAGTPTPIQNHDHNELQLPYQSGFLIPQLSIHARCGWYQRALEWR